MSDAHYPEWICHECGCRWGRRPAGPNHLATYHEGTCDICGTIASVTEPRDYGHLTIGWQNEPNLTKRRTDMSDLAMETDVSVESVAFEGPNTPDRGYTIRASYLKEPHKADALIEVMKDGEVVRQFLFPAYKIYNLQAHFRDIVDGEIENSTSGYQKAAWNGMGSTVLLCSSQEAVSEEELT